MRLIRPASDNDCVQKYVLSELDSGERVISERIPSVRSVAIGFWIGAGSRDETEAKAGVSHFIEHLYILPECQDRGLGRQLLEKAMAGARELRLWTFQANEKARRFYERHGFTAERLTDGADNEEKQPDVLYHWVRPD